MSNNNLHDLYVSDLSQEELWQLGRKMDTSLTTPELVITKKQWVKIPTIDDSMVLCTRDTANYLKLLEKTIEDAGIIDVFIDSSIAKQLLDIKIEELKEKYEGFMENKIIRLLEELVIPCVTKDGKTTDITYYENIEVVSYINYMLSFIKQEGLLKPMLPYEQLLRHE